MAGGVGNGREQLRQVWQPWVCWMCLSLPSPGAASTEPPEETPWGGQHGLILNMSLLTQPKESIGLGSLWREEVALPQSAAGAASSALPRDLPHPGDFLPPPFLPF